MGPKNKKENDSTQIKEGGVTGSQELGRKRGQGDEGRSFGSLRMTGA
jgi:hypothetical protein